MTSSIPRVRSQKRRAARTVAAALAALARTPRGARRRGAGPNQRGSRRRRRPRPRIARAPGVRTRRAATGPRIPLPASRPPRRPASRGERPTARAPDRAEVALDELVDRIVRWRGLRQGLLSEAAMRGRVHMHPGATGLEHLANGRRDTFPLHPVEGLREGRDPEGAQARPGAAPHGGAPSRRSRCHGCSAWRAASASISASASTPTARSNNGASSSVSEPGPTADVQQPSATVEREVVPERRRELGGIGEAASRIVGSAARVQRVVPHRRQPAAASAVAKRSCAILAQ